MLAQSALLRGALTMGVIGLLLFFFKPWESVPALIAASPVIVLLALVGVGINLLMNAFSYYFILKSIRPVPFRKVARYNVYSWVTESILPGKIGSFAIAFFLQKEGLRLGEALALVLAYRVALAAGALLFALSGAFLLFPSVQLNPLLLIGIAFALPILMVLGRRPIRALLMRFIPSAILSKMGGFSSTLKQFLTPGRVVLLLLMAFVQLAIISGVFWAMYWVSGYSLSFWAVLAAFSIVQLAALLPITINGIGVREGLTAVLLAQVGAPESVSLVLASINTIVGYVVIFLASSWIAPALPLEKMADFFREKKK